MDGKTTNGGKCKISDFPRGWVGNQDGILSVLESEVVKSRNGGDIVTENRSGN